MELPLSIDRSLFLFFNTLPHFPVSDALALLFSGVGTAGFIWIVISIYIFFQEERKDRYFFLPVAIAAVGSWIISDIWLKSFFGRIRPTVDIGAIVVGDGATNFSFPSTHATFAWALALVLSRKEPRYAGWFYALAVIISLSRIYLGVHYPGDIIGGTLLGLGIGHIALEVDRFAAERRNKKTRRQRR